MVLPDLGGETISPRWPLPTGDSISITREVKDPISNEIQIAADYSQLGDLIWATIIIGLLLPIGAILVVRYSRLKWA